MRGEEGRPAECKKTTARSKGDPRTINSEDARVGKNGVLVFHAGNGSLGTTFWNAHSLHANEI